MQRETDFFQNKIKLTLYLVVEQLILKNIHSKIGFQFSQGSVLFHQVPKLSFRNPEESLSKSWFVLRSDFFKHNSAKTTNLSEHLLKPLHLQRGAFHGSVTDLSVHHPLGFNRHPFEGAGMYIYIYIYIIETYIYTNMEKTNKFNNFWLIPTNPGSPENGGI